MSNLAFVEKKKKNFPPRPGFYTELALRPPLNFRETFRVFPRTIVESFAEVDTQTAVFVSTAEIWISGPDTQPPIFLGFLGIHSWLWFFCRDTKSFGYFPEVPVTKIRVSAPALYKNPTVIPPRSKFSFSLENFFLGLKFTFPLEHSIPGPVFLRPGRGPEWKNHSRLKVSFRIESLIFSTLPLKIDFFNPGALCHTPKRPFLVFQGHFSAIVRVFCGCFVGVQNLDGRKRAF